MGPAGVGGRLTHQLLVTGSQLRALVVLLQTVEPVGPEGRELAQGDGDDALVQQRCGEQGRGLGRGEPLGTAQPGTLHELPK